MDNKAIHTDVFKIEYQEPEIIRLIKAYDEALRRTELTYEFLYKARQDLMMREWANGKI